MKIGVILHMQLSSYGSLNGDGVRFGLPMSDSNSVVIVHQLKATLGGLLRGASDGTDPCAHVVCALPDNVHPTHREEFAMELLAETSKYNFVDFTAYVSLESGSSAMADRFSFDFEAAVDTVRGLLSEGCDRILVWANDPMKVAHWRAVESELHLNDGVHPSRMTVFTYVSWLAGQDPLAELYRVRQVEGLQLSDAVFVNSWWAADLVHQLVPGLRAPVHRLPLYSLLTGHEDTQRDEHPTLLYNHRLSSADYYRIPAERVAQIVGKVTSTFNETESAWTVVVSNPSAKNTDDNVFAKHGVRMCGLTGPAVPLTSRKLYGELIERCWLSTVLFQGAMWNLSAQDCFAVGVPVVYAAVDGLRELWPAGGYPWACATMGDAELRLAGLLTEMAEEDVKRRIFDEAEELSLKYAEARRAGWAANEILLQDLLYRHS